MTDSEILAGIDGLFMSQQVRAWTHSIHHLRLSQILDMYYSAKGIPILTIENSSRKPQPNENSESKDQAMFLHSHQDSISLSSFSTESNDKLRAVFKQPDLYRSNRLERFSVSDGINRACNRRNILQVIDKQKLREETFLLAQVLQLSTSSMAISDDVLKQNCDATVKTFFNYSGLSCASPRF